MDRTTEPRELAHYEGLIFKTALLLREPTRHGPPVQMEREDIEQILRIKVWEALEKYDATRSKLPLENYVFMCLTSKSIDLRNRRRRRDESYIEDVTRSGTPDGEHGDWFDARYLAADHDQVYGHVEEDELLMPSTLDVTERAIVVALYGGYKQTEIAQHLRLARGEVDRAVRSIRVKMADWSPGAEAARQLELV